MSNHHIIINRPSKKDCLFFPSPFQKRSPSPSICHWPWLSMVRRGDSFTTGSGFLLLSSMASSSLRCTWRADRMVVSAKRWLEKKNPAANVLVKTITVFLSLVVLASSRSNQSFLLQKTSSDEWLVADFLLGGFCPMLQARWEKDVCKTWQVNH